MPYHASSYPACGGNAAACAAAGVRRRCGSQGLSEHWLQTPRCATHAMLCIHIGSHACLHRGLGGEKMHVLIVRRSSRHALANMYDSALTNRMVTSHNGLGSRHLSAACAKNWRSALDPAYPTHPIKHRLSHCSAVHGFP